MNTLKSKTIKIVTAATLGGAMIATLSGFAAAPVQAAQPVAPQSSQLSGEIPVEVTLDPIAIVAAISEAVNDQDDRAGALKAALDVGYYSNANPERLTVAVVNKNQDINVEGSIAHAQPIDIKGGSYVIYWFNGPGKVTNNGDGGFLNWGVLGNIVRTDNVISVNGG